MKKKALSLILALVMILALASAAFAVEVPHNVDMGALQSYGWNYGGDSAGAKITLNGVIGESTAMFQGHAYPCYDIVVGGGFTLDMTFPKGQGREYSVMLDPVVLDGDSMDMDLWPVPEDEEWLIFKERDHKSQYVFTSTEAMVSKPGSDMTFVFYVGWYVEGEDGGSVDFTLRFHPASEVGNIAYASTQNVLVDGKSVEFQCYALKDANGYPTNYIKLRDLALLLNGTPAQFEIGWDGSVTVTTGKAYTPNGSELSTPFTGDRELAEDNSVTVVNGKTVDLAAFMLTDDHGGGYTYYKLRDIGQAFGFNVGWGNKGAFIETDKPYDPNN